MEGTYVANFRDCCLSPCIRCAQQLLTQAVLWLGGRVEKQTNDFNAVMYLKETTGFRCF